MPKNFQQLKLLCMYSWAFLLRLLISVTRALVKILIKQDQQNPLFQVGYFRKLYGMDLAAFIKGYGMRRWKIHFFQFLCSFHQPIPCQKNEIAYLFLLLQKIDSQISNHIVITRALILRMWDFEVTTAY